MDKLRTIWGQSLLPRIALLILSILPAAILLPGFWNPESAVAWLGFPSTVRVTIGSIIITAAIIRAIDLYFRSRWDRFYLDALLAVPYISAGMILLIYHGSGMWAVTPILSLYFLIEGSAKIYLSIEMQTSSEICLLFSGTLSFIRGFLFIYFGLIPEIYLLATAVFVGIDLFFEGLCGIANRLNYSGNTESPRC